MSRILVTFLFGLSTLDPVTFVGVAPLLIAVATMAWVRPARRATEVDPIVALHMVLRKPPLKRPVGFGRVQVREPPI